MEAKEGLLRIGIPTGFGTNGVRKEALKIARVMLAQMSSGNIEEHWTKYYIPRGNTDEYFTNRYYHDKWGVVLSVEVPDLEYALSIMKSFEYDEVYMTEKEKRDRYKTYYDDPKVYTWGYSKSYAKKHVIGDGINWD